MLSAELQARAEDFARAFLARLTHRELVQDRAGGPKGSFAVREAIFFTGGDPLHRRSGSSSGSSGLALLAAERAGGDAEATRSGGRIILI